ncbi:LppU/SCO3897 family protein [Micromonospora sp. WMMD730]|uniref:LppU/SCO3897 family protein n=1 Tax=Micromonospora sp. WMMD730 TaxID=3404128 RepID=UPI003B925AD0
MTSEGQHRPGQEPGEAPPGSGGPTPYGDRQPQQDPGYGVPATPDLGWAPPPPAGRANPPGPSWSAPDQPAAWGGAQVPQQSEPTEAWNPPPGGAPPTEAWTPPAGPPQPAWAGQPEQPAWAAAPAPAAGKPDSSPQPGWAPSHESGWAQAEQPAPAWAQPEAGARGAARVPQPDNPAGGGWSPPADPAPTSPAGWSGQDAAAREATPGTNGWGTAPAPQQDDPARSGGWPADDRADAERADADRGHANRGNGWPGDDRAGADPARGGWPAGPQDGPGNSGGWATRGPSRPDEAHRPAGRASVPVPAPAEPTNQTAAWPQPEAGAQAAGNAAGVDSRSTEDDPSRSGGWAANRPGPDDAGRPGDWPNGTRDDRQPPWGAPDEPATARWEGQHEQATPDGWPGGAPARADQSRQDDPASGQEWPAPVAQRGAASVPSPEHQESGAAWATPEQPARASASVSAPDGPPAWAGNDHQQPPWPGAERPVVPEGEPWAPEQAWGRAEPAGQPAEGGWEPRRGDDQPIYQPGPAPGISPANKVPLPPQEQRVPGASLAAAPPADYVPPAPFGGPGDQQPHGREAAGWGAPEQPQLPAGPALPAQRLSPESEGAGRAQVPTAEAGEPGAVGRASASASVPTASRVAPPNDQAAHPAGPVVPQPRVYGRPARPEPPEEAEEHDPRRPEQHDARFADQDRTRFDGPEQPRFDDQDRTRFDGPRFDDQERQHGFGGDAPSSAPPAAPPAFGGGIPAFADPAGSNRPMNGTRPHGPADRPAEPFGAGPTSGAPAGAAPVPGYGHPAHDPAHGGYASPFPPAGQQFGPAGQPSGPTGWPGEPEQEQGRFDAFKPDAEPEQKAEQPTPKVRNGRVLALVLIAAVLILAVPLGLLMLLGKIGSDDDKPAPFNPAVGSCVKQSGNGASAANCDEQGAFTVVSKVDAKEKCTDPTQPHVVLQGGGVDRVLCLKPAGQ